MQRALNYDRSPAPGVSWRFFAVAAVFAMLASLTLAWHGQDALSSRWTPAALAASHLLGIGAITATIIGALFQIAPVVTGMTIPGTQPFATVVLALLGAGTLTLAGAFLLGRPILFGLGAAALGMGLLLFAALAGAGLWLARRSMPAGARPLAIATGLALAGLTLAVCAGATAALARAGLPGALIALDALSLPLPVLGRLHVGWALAGWIGMVLVAVAPQVIPMFQVTEPYPAASERWMPCLLIGALLLWTAATSLQPAAAQPTGFDWMAAAPAWAALALFAALTLRTLRTRKRPAPDGTTRFWYLSITCLCLALALLPAQALPGAGLLAGALFLAGFAWTAIIGMLYTILPFLAWLHAHHQARDLRPTMPKMRDMLPPAMALQHFRLHLCGLLTLAGACLWPSMLARPAGLLLAGSAAWVLGNLWRCWRIYRQALIPPDAS